jgi:hypothetical protein
VGSKYLREGSAKYLKAGAILACLAVGAVAVLLILGGSKTPSCDLTAAAAGAIVAGVTHGRDVAEIVAPAVTGAAVPGACKSVVDTLIKTPAKQVTLKINLPDGTQATSSLKGIQLPSTQTSSAPRSCGNWIAESLRTLCNEGRLPPAAPVAPSVPVGG